MEIIIYILAVIGFISIFVLIGSLLLTNDDWKEIEIKAKKIREGG